MVCLLMLENHTIAVGLNPGFVADEGLREVVNGYVYAVGAKLVFDDRGDGLPVAAGKAGAKSRHVNAGVVFECKEAELNGHEASRPAAIVAFRLVEALGERAHEPGVPEAGVIATVGNDSFSRRYWIGGVAGDVFDCHLSQHSIPRSSRACFS